MLDDALDLARRAHESQPRESDEVLHERIARLDKRLSEVRSCSAPADGRSVTEMANDLARGKISYIDGHHVIRSAFGISDDDARLIYAWYIGLHS